MRIEPAGKDARFRQKNRAADHADHRRKKQHRQIEYGFDAELTLPDPTFNRGIGVFRDINATPEGKLIGDDEWRARQNEWLPSPDDYAFVRSLMAPVTEPGKMAGWIAPPKRGIHGKPLDFDYVLFH